MNIGKCFGDECLVYGPVGQFYRVWWTPVSRKWTSVSTNLVTDIRKIT